MLQILLDGKKAVGVEFIRSGRKLQILVNQEVIISGGSVDSPKLLMLSGIGPKKHLESFGVNCIFSHIGATWDGVFQH